MKTLLLLLLFQLPVYDPNPGATDPRTFNEYFENITTSDTVTAPFRWFGFSKGKVEVKFTTPWVHTPSCSVRDLDSLSYGAPDWVVEVTKEHFVFQDFPAGDRLEWKCQGVVRRLHPLGDK